MSQPCRQILDKTEQSCKSLLPSRYHHALNGLALSKSHTFTPLPTPFTSREPNTAAPAGISIILSETPYFTKCYCPFAALNMAVTEQHWCDSMQHFKYPPHLPCLWTGTPSDWSAAVRPMRERRRHTGGSKEMFVQWKNEEKTTLPPSASERAAPRLTITKWQLANEFLSLMRSWTQQHQMR